MYGLLDDLPTPTADPPNGAVRHEGVFSLVVDDSGDRVRSLPSAYFGAAQIFADRDVAKVKQVLTRSVRVALEADKVPSYLITACRLGNKFGLYTKDIFNRSVFRRRVSRAGLDFADDPFVEMTPDGRFRCEGGDVFHPAFVLVNKLATVGASPSGVLAHSDDNVNRGGFLTFLFGILRVGTVRPDELRALGRMIPTLEVVSEADPEEAVEAIRQL